VGLGLLMIAAGWTGLVLWLRGALFETRWYLRPVSYGWWMGFVAVICGWIVTETGRQPWVIQGILRTADATSPHTAESVAFTLALFVIVYAIIFGFGIFYMNRLIVRGPEGAAVEPPSQWTPGRTLPSAEEATRESLS
jgi:cytochrome bd ubiquinol oxidase subunit I